ncbi:cyclopropane-fatty-acyl-phospholipid synthase family protein [Alphaproteobacteria bacterium]|jgi:cyclopropane-fatty-acyl-phospholipid synthase|nr:cyclopropane-fatty-acyl-phospholipid synthase family protein [Alphaproteobacteria bacterium]
MTDTASEKILNNTTPGSTKFIERLGGALTAGELTVTTPKKKVFRFTGPEDGPHAELKLQKTGLAGKILAGGDVGFAEAYIDGICDSPDLTALIELGAMNEYASWTSFLKGRNLYRWFARLGHALKPNSKRGAKRNIKSHYDLGNDFYALWLDPSMTYSSAVYPNTSSTLEEAQRHKYQLLIDELKLEPSHHLLEIGCGWGGFAVYAAEMIGCKITAVTISQAQYDFARRRIENAGLNDKITLLLRDYRDLEGRYDRVVSIEMLEAVGESYWASYFTKLNALLKEGGRAALQVITIEKTYWQSYRSNPDFIQQYIFPGGMLPTIERLQDEAGEANLAWERCQGYASDYAKTLAVWREAFHKAWPKLEKLGFDERFRRMWHYYLCYCEAGFNVGRINVDHITLRHINQ